MFSLNFLFSIENSTKSYFASSNFRCVNHNNWNRHVCLSTRRSSYDQLIDLSTTNCSGNIIAFWDFLLNSNLAFLLALYRSCLVHCLHVNTRTSWNCHLVRFSSQPLGFGASAVAVEFQPFTREIRNFNGLWVLWGWNQQSSMLMRYRVCAPQTSLTGNSTAISKIKNSSSTLLNAY